MDFSGQYNQFSAPTAQPYHQPHQQHQQQQFMSIPPPLTPSNSHSAGSDDFNASPPETFEALPTDQQQQHQFHAFDFSQSAFTPNISAHQPIPAFPGPPTPPNHNHVFAGQPQHQQQRQQHQLGHGALPSSLDGDMMGVTKSDTTLDDQTAQQQRGGGSEEDENMTPAQSRRKAQNRAAQRAFRERKEKHVKDLEAKLANLEAAQQQASVENERLKGELHKMHTENKILRATSSVSAGPHGSLSPEPTITGPMKYKPTDFYSDLLTGHSNKTPSHRIVNIGGERLLAAGATWDLIINHESYKKGLVDIGVVSERLRGNARCDGQGPVFAEGTILAAIEDSVASGSDDLL